MVAEAHDQLLDALRPFAPARVADEEAQAEVIRQRSDDAKDEERLVQRVAHWRPILTWADHVPAQEVFPAQPGPTQEQVRRALALAHKILADREDPEAGDPVRSVHDPAARRGKHGGSCDGYLLDVALDADSDMVDRRPGAAGPWR